MTNAEAYKQYYSERMDFVLSVAGIDPSADDQLELSSAYAMREYVLQPNWTQGGTSEDYSNVVSEYKARYRAIFNKYGVVDDSLKASQPTINRIVW